GFTGPSSALSAAALSRVSASHEVEGAADDRGRVDAVDGMGLTHRGGLTEIADTEVADAVAADPGEEGQSVRVTVEHGHQRGRMGGGEQLLGDGRTAARTHLRPPLDGTEIFHGELRHTMPARTPRDSSRPAASITSVMIAPAPTSVTSSSAAGRADSR